MRIIKELPELLKAGVISEETADKISSYYDIKGGKSQNVLVIVFGILGAILTGLGLILIIAHNWDDFSNSVKLFFAFLPLIIGQAICAYTLIKKADMTVWRESSAAFLFFAVGASISLVSQIYNIPGEIRTFMLTWMLLCLPLIYVMRSSVASLLYLAGITEYAINTYSSHCPSSELLIYWMLLVLVLPYYYNLFRKNPQGNFIVFHNWFVPVSMLVALGTVEEHDEELLFVAYMSLLGLFYLIGNTPHFKEQKTRNNAYRTLGSLGTVGLLMMLSFDWIWKILRGEKFDDLITSPEFFISGIVSSLACILLFYNNKNKPFREWNPIEFVFIAFIMIFIIGMFAHGAVVLINIMIFAIGVLTIRNGARQDDLGILNYGLIILSVLVVCRFFDTDLSFVIRGLLFVGIGLGFFVANYNMLKKRKENEQ